MRRIVTRETISCFRSVCAKGCRISSRVRACIIQAGKTVSFEGGGGAASVAGRFTVEHKPFFSSLKKTMQRWGAARERTPLFTRAEKARIRTRAHTHIHISSFKPTGLPFIFIHPRLLYIHSRVNSNHSDLARITTLPNGIIAY